MAASTKGLEKVSGYSFEDVVETLKREGISHRVMSEPHATQQYFCESSIGVEEEIPSLHAVYVRRAKGLFSSGNVRNCSAGAGFVCYAGYRITLEFDLSVLDGHPRFSKGLLIEATWVR